MKLTWFGGLAAAVAFAWPAMSSAQDHWSQPSSIGSYQSVVTQPQLAAPNSAGPTTGYQQPGPTSNFGPATNYGAQPNTNNYGGQPNANSYRYPPQMRTPPVQPAAYGTYQPGFRQDAPAYPPNGQAGPIVDNAPQFQPLPSTGGAPLHAVPMHGVPCDGFNGQGQAYYGGPVSGPASYGNGGCDTGCNSGCGNGYASGYDSFGSGYGGRGGNIRGGHFGGGRHAFSGNRGYDYLDAGCNDGGCGTGSDFGNNGRLFQERNNSANWVAGANALFFARDYEDDLGLSFNNAGQYLFSTDADNNYFGGVETFISRRNCSGWGWETRFWGLFPGTVVTPMFGTLYTNLTGTRQLIHPNSGRTVEEVYNRGERHEVQRENEFYNVEFNMLRSGGCYTGLFGQTVNYELLGGFRWFQFNEVFSYATYTTWPTYPTSFSYDVDVRNTLLGLQIGGRTERCLTRRLSLTRAFKVGLFNNHIAQDQCMCDNTGDFAQIWSGPYTGQDFNFMSNKNDIAMLGELDLGGVYQFSNCARAAFGYRAIGISGVALGPDQIPYNFTDVNEINRINSNGSLILHGAYAGLQFCF